MHKLKFLIIVLAGFSQISFAADGAPVSLPVFNRKDAHKRLDALLDQTGFDERPGLRADTVDKKSWLERLCCCARRSGSEACQLKKDN